MLKHIIWFLDTGYVTLMSVDTDRAGVTVVIYGESNIAVLMILLQCHPLLLGIYCCAHDTATVSPPTMRDILMYPWYCYSAIPYY